MMTSGKKNGLARIGRNMARIARSCTPPFLQKVLYMEVEKSGDHPETEPQETANQVAAEFLIPSSTAVQIWPGFDQTEVTMLPRQIRDHLWAMPENELLVLSTICRILQPKRIFEFGTFTGASTLAIAANTDNDARIHTLDIPPDHRRSHRTGVGSDIPFDFQIGRAFLETKWEAKIEIHQEDTREFDPGPYLGKMDLVFVDADHTYEFVKNDSRKAMEMLSPGGVILWHDYRWDEESPECAGVTHCVNEIHSTHGNCREIEGTRFAVYQSCEPSRYCEPSSHCEPSIHEVVT